MMPKQHNYIEQEQYSGGQSNLFEAEDMTKLIKIYLEDDVPENLKTSSPIVKQFWAILGKSVKLTFLDQEDVMDFEFLFNQARYTLLMSMPSYKVTFDDLQQLDQIKLHYYASLKRAVGTNKQKLNERIILGSTINQSISSSQDSSTSSVGIGRQSGSFFNKLSKFF